MLIADYFWPAPSYGSLSSHDFTQIDMGNFPTFFANITYFL
jgi:hypothetical protein